MKSRTTAGRQMRRALNSPMIPEQAGVLQTSCDPDEFPAGICKRKRLKVDTEIGGTVVPAGSQLLSCSADIDGGRHPIKANWGLPLAEQTAFDFAVAAKHPFSAPPVLPPGVCEAISAMVKLGPREWARHADAVVTKWEANTERLRGKEHEVHNAMRKELAAVLAGKQILSFQAALKDIGHPDIAIAGDIAAGLRLTGVHPPSGTFPVKPPAAVAHGRDPENLWITAPHGV